MSRSSLLIPGVLGIVAAIVWFNASELLWPARVMLVVITAFLPVLAAAQVNALAQLDPLPRLALYLNSILSLWILAAITLVAARASGFTPALLGLRMPALGPFLLWTAIPVISAAVLHGFVKFLRLRESRLLSDLLPQRRSEKAVFVGVSLTAGICEELVFRGFLTAAFAVAFGSLPVAVVLGVLVFGGMHVYQSTAGVLRASVMGLALTAPLLFAGSIFPAIVAHVLIDLIGGLVLPRRWLVQDSGLIQGG